MNRPENPPEILTEIQAGKRYDLLKQGTIDYHLSLLLKKGPEYSGSIIIEFEALPPYEGLFLDFSGKRIESLKINGCSTPIEWDGLFLHLPAQAIQDGKTKVEISFIQNYQTDGCGIHSFVDTDGHQYLYSQFESYLTHKAFPNFDQPDLKARLQLNVKAPIGQIILSNETGIKEQTIMEDDIEYQQWTFPTTKLLPTYLYAIVAGPWDLLENTSDNYKGIPMSLGSRHSLHPHMMRLSEFFFEITNRAMEWYEKFFGCNFPFNKYDQVFCPEYNCGAMENASLVTFNDIYVFREEVDAGRYGDLANTITHELAHHWFGNLVTMKWWNDLWLNESFADFISYYCLIHLKIQSKQIGNVWVAMNRRKAWGYRADQLSTTHPIAGPVPDTDAAASIFDGITYAKGSATLRQLLCLMGHDAFSEAMKNYFHKFAFQNATIDDFIAVMDVEFSKQNLGFNLMEWKDQWICKAGLNECEPIFNPNDKNNQAVLKILQRPTLCDHPTLRRHKMKVAFFAEDGTFQDYDVLLQVAPETELVYDGSKDFQAVFLNYGDQTFIKTLLDMNSCDYFKKNLHIIKASNPEQESQLELTRTLIWRAFYDMVRDQKLTTQEYVEIFMRAIVNEPSDDIIKVQYEYVSTAFWAYTPISHRDELANKLFDFTVGQMAAMMTNPSISQSRILCIKPFLLRFSKTARTDRWLYQLYNDEHEQFKGLELGFDLQWGIVANCFSRSSEFTVQEQDEIHQKQEKIDPSDTARQMKIQLDATRLREPERKAKYDHYFSSDCTLSLRELNYAFKGFNNELLQEELQPYWDHWLNNFESLPYCQNPDAMSRIYHPMFPKTDNLKWLQDTLNKRCEGVPADKTMLLRLLKESLDDVSRQIRCQDFYKERHGS